jgi:hypothetical protein
VLSPVEVRPTFSGLIDDLEKRLNERFSLIIARELYLIILQEYFADACTPDVVNRVDNNMSTGVPVELFSYLTGRIVTP